MSCCCRNLGKTIKKAIPSHHLHLRSLGGSLYRRRIQSSSMETDLKSTFLNVYSVLKSDLLHDPSFEFTNESRLWVDRVSLSHQSDPTYISFECWLILSFFADAGLQCTWRSDLSTTASFSLSLSLFIDLLFFSHTYFFFSRETQSGSLCC